MILALTALTVSGSLRKFILTTLLDMVGLEVGWEVGWEEGKLVGESEGIGDGATIVGE